MLCLFACITGITAEVCEGDTTTCVDIAAADAVQGSALLQVKRAPTKEDIDATSAVEKSTLASCMQLEIQEAYNSALQEQGSHSVTNCGSDADSKDHQDPVGGSNTNGYYDQSGTWRPGKPPTSSGSTSAGSSGSTGASDPFGASLDAAGFLAVTSTCCAWKMEVFFTRLLESMGFRICSKPHLQGLMHWFTCVPAMDYKYILQIIANGNEHGCKFWAKKGETCPSIVGTKCDNPCKP